jgi:hypothetical protein
VDGKQGVFILDRIQWKVKNEDLTLLLCTPWIFSTKVKGKKGMNHILYDGL